MDVGRKLLLVSGSIIFLTVTSIFVLNINFHEPVVQAQSCSNYPDLSPGDIILIEDTKFNEIEENNTVVYNATSKDLVVTHQVISKTEDSLQTKGINNEQQLPFEQNVEPSQIWGTPAFVLPLSAGEVCSA